MNEKSGARNDMRLVMGILLIAVILLFVFRQIKEGVKESGYAVVTVDGTEYGRYLLSEDRVEVIETEYGVNELRITQGIVDMTDADCPDLTCVDMKAISKSGETIVCLPHKLVVEIEGADAAELDSIAQ